MKSLYALPFSLIFFSLISVAEGKEPTVLSYGQGKGTIDAMMPNKEDIAKKFTNSSSDFTKKLEYVFSNFKPIQILDKVDLVNANSEADKLGYIKKYCGVVMTTSIIKDRSSFKSPLVQLIMMTDHFSPVKVTLPFRSSSNMKMDKKTLDYYSNKYSGKAVCTDKVIVGNTTEGGINYILPHNYVLDTGLLEIDYTDMNYIQIF